MGIHGLTGYIKSSNCSQLSQCESGNNLYVSNIVYYDLTYKLIDLYNSFILSKCRQNISSLNVSEEVDRMIQFITIELIKLFNKLKSFNRIIYAFVDYKFENKIISCNKLFKDFIQFNNNEDEVLKSIPLIKRKYAKEIEEMSDENVGLIDMNKISKMSKSIKCMFEFKNIYALSDESMNIENYISIPCLIKRLKANESIVNESIVNESMANESAVNESTVNESINENVNTSISSSSVNKLKLLSYLLQEGKYRYLILRGAKRDTRNNRTKRIMSGNIITDLEHEHETISVHENNSSIHHEKFKHLNTSNVNHEQIERMNKSKLILMIPFTIVIYMMPEIIKNININEVKFIGCEVESDFALSKHIHTYFKNAYPTVYTNDTDLLVHLCDVNCVVKLVVRKKVKFNKCESCSFLINPVLFWRNIFGCDLSPKIIKSLCVLMGTDYNLPNSLSPIHIKQFTDILKILNVERFEEINEDKLLTNIYIKLSTNPFNTYCRQTAIALNMYLNEVENQIHYIKGENKNKERFLIFSHQNLSKDIK